MKLKEERQPEKMGFVSLGDSAFHSTKNIRKTRKTVPEFPENPEIAEFPKNELFHRKSRKFQEESQMEQKFWVRNLRKLGILCKDVPFFGN